MDSDQSFWEYQVKDKQGHWDSPSASGQEPHRYTSREEAFRILCIIHPGEPARLVHYEELNVPGKDS